MPSLALTEDALEQLSTEKHQQEFYDSIHSSGGSFGVRISNKGTKVFFLIYSLHGKRKRMSLGRYPMVSLAEARERAQETFREVSLGRDPAAELRQYRKASTFGQVASLFLSEHAERSCAESTYREYRRIISRELLPCWADIKLDDLTRSHVMQLTQEISSHREKPVLAKRVQALISKICSFAQQRGLLKENPASGIRIPAAPYPRERFLTWDEIKSLWLVLTSEKTLVSGVFKLLLLSGQKPGEVLSMRWDDIVLETWTIGKKPSPEQSKHQVYLNQQAVQVLREVRELVAPGEYVFTNGRGTHLTYIRKAARRLNQQMNLDIPWAPMDLRKTFELRLGELGVRPDVIERMMNRSSRLSPKMAKSQVYDYFPEIKSAMILWGRTLAKLSSPGTDNEPEGKVVPLFG